MRFSTAAAAGHPLAGDRERLSDVGRTMIDASLCGLGQTAATAVLSAMKLWPEMFDASNNSEYEDRRFG